MPVEKIESVGSGSRSGDSITRVYMCDLDDAAALWSEYTHNAQYVEEGGYFNRDRSSITPGECFATARLVFTETPTVSSSGAGGGNREDGDTEYNFDTSTTDIQLERHPQYRTYWNHVLLSTKEITSSPSWYLNATDTVIPESDREKYKWASPGDSYSDPWVVLVDIPEEWRGIQGKLYPQPVLVVTEYYHDRASAVAKLTAVGLLKSPPWSGPYKSEAKYWLVTNSTVSTSGRYWVHVEQYTYADMGWNETLYSEEGQEA